MAKVIKTLVMYGDAFGADKLVPANFLQNLIFQQIMYATQEQYESQLRELGLMDNSAFTCACYLDQLGNTPKKGEVLSWAESSAVVYANSVLGARCNFGFRTAGKQPNARHRQPGRRVFGLCEGRHDGHHYREWNGLCGLIQKSPLFGEIFHNFMTKNI